MCVRARATTPCEPFTPLQGEPPAKPHGGVSPAPGAPRSPPLPRESSRCPLSPAPGGLPSLTPSAVPVPLPCSSRDGWDEPQRGWSRGILRGPLHSAATDNRRENGSCSPLPLCGRTRWNVPSAAVPLPSARGERSALTPPSPGLGFARPPAMAGEGRACCTAASSTSLPKPHLSRYRGAAGGRARPRAGALGAAPPNQS